MESSVVVATVAALAGAAAMLLLVAVVLVATRSRRSRADLEAQLESARAENDHLRRRVDELTRPAVAAPEPADFVITHVGEPEPAPESQAVPDRLVLSATLGVPLVKAAAFSHGVRRALSAESRNRIWFEMRREVRAARRQRRQLRKHLEREYRARLRASEDPVMESQVVGGPVVGGPA
jgi:hypothetical protein